MSQRDEAAGDPALAAFPKFRNEKKKSLPRRLFFSVLKVLAVLFLTFHTYALALKFVGPPGTILMVQRGLAGEDVRRNWVSLDEMSPHLVRAVIAAEDAKFCTHPGIDFEAVQKAAEHNKKSKKRRGGSTVTQQTAKNVFFWNGGGMVRKAGEAWMALLIDKVWGKRRVMEVYLNVAEWGDGLFGAEAAAQARFGKSAKDLTRLEAARLAAVLPSPNKWSADKPGPYVRKRTGTLQARMNVVESEGYAACVLKDEAAPKVRKPQPGEPKTPAPEPVMPELPEAPEEDLIADGEDADAAEAAVAGAVEGEAPVSADPLDTLLEDVLTDPPPTEEVPAPVTEIEPLPAEPAPDAPAETPANP
jgi:monofunctional biosynthetic peptidoglycan transglycosylase